MELNFTRISRSEGVKEEFDIVDHLDGKTMDFGGEKLVLLSPVRVRGSAVNYEGKINVELHITAQVERICSRCLDAFKEDVEVDSRYVFVREAKDDKEDYYVFKGDKVDITEFVLNDIAAKLTMKPLCKETCKGICPICGKNKNITDCQCKNEQIDPRLQALGKLLDRE
jgi:uncharacterized protein